jgi:membrane associated rhomboid family serine protease
MSFAREFDRKLQRTGRPATTLIIGAIGLSFLLAWFTKSPFFVETLGFISWSKPWTALTYPFASFGDGGGFVGLLLELWWLWWMGYEVESVVGTTRFVIFFALVTLVGAIGISIGHVFAGAGLSGAVPLLSPLIPIGALTVAWATRSPGATIRLYAVIPITAFWLAWIFVGIVIFNYGNGAPIIGVCGTLALAFSWVFASNRIPGMPYSAVVAEKQSKAAKLKAVAYENEVRSRKVEREERERLRKLFEGSLDDK